MWGRVRIHVLPSADISIHSWSSVYFFSFTALSQHPCSPLNCFSELQMCVRAADTENNRGFCVACCHLWQTNGDGLFAAAEVNWRAARAIEVRAAIVANCVWVVKLQVAGAGEVITRAKTLVELLRDYGKVGRIRTLFATEGTTATTPRRKRGKMLYEMIGVV